MKNKTRNKAVSSPAELLLVLLILLADAFLVLISVESVCRKSLNLALNWIFAYRSYALMTLAILLSLLIFLAFLTRRISLSVLFTNGLAAALAAVDYFKLALRNEPLMFTDISQAREALEISGGYHFEADRFTLFMLALLLLPVLLTVGIRLKKRRLPVRAAETLCGLLLLCLSLYTGFRRFNRYAYRAQDFAQVDGLIGGIVATVPQASAPDGYTEENVRASLNGAVSRPSEAAVKPDILFIMCESLYDPARIPGMTLSGDPLPNLRALQAEGWGGNLVSSQFGGGTAETEYEVLTGYRARDLTGASYVTPGILKSGMRTVVTLLEGEGYGTRFMHPGAGSFYNRKNALKKLGFESSSFLPDFGPAEKKVGSRPADSWLFPKVLESLAAEQGGAPRFLYVTTFQNHGGYDTGTKSREIRVSGVGDEYLNAAENYVNGIRLTDESLPILFDAFRKSDRPVLVVLYGDHCPSFDSFGVNPGTSDKGLYLSYTTPLLIWSNFGFTPSVPSGSDVSAYRLGALILHDLGYTEDAYYNSLADAPNLMKQSGKIVRGGKTVTDEEAWQRETDRLWLLHYDRVFGKNYSR